MTKIKCTVARVEEKRIEVDGKMTITPIVKLVPVDVVGDFYFAVSDGKIDYKALSAVKDTALRAVATRLRVDRNAMMQKKVDKLAELLDRLKKPGDEAKLIEAQPMSDAAE